ncbi:hypothetical protein [Treponema saccharophilum]|uniref:hypothetical protein n=1 Tax=Treponema saccharophilum TaxID=165 RepID=UPI001146DAE4|nr:hypothetical protein [Treponema saccharophilum]
MAIKNKLEGLTMTVTTEKELGNAIHDNVDTIEIEGDLGKKVVKIKATGKVAWAACIGSLTIAIIATVAAMIPDPAEPVEIGVAGIAYGFSAVTLGAATTSAVSIGIAGAIAAGATGAAVGSAAIGILNKLREYKITEKSEGKVILKR